MALLAPPKILLLDEISNGVDPLARKNLYSFLHQLKETTTFLITHRIDEVEKICDQVGIIVDGTIREINSPQRLKEDFGALFLLQVDVKLEDNAMTVSEVDELIQQMLPFLRRMSEAEDYDDTHLLTIDGY